MMIQKVNNSGRFAESSGFSLIELLVVIAIIGIMSAIGIPMLLNPEHKAKKVAREIMGDMQKARISAVRSNQDWAVVFDTANDQYLICSDPGVDDVWSTTADNSIEKIVSFTEHSEGVEYGNGPATTNANVGGGAFPADSVSYTSNVLTFNSRGTCSAGWVYISYGDAAYAVGTLSTGIVRVRRWSGGAWQ
jgi:prepilin-type N-terminal cleavage/methylation domain-containing protein